MYSTWRVRRKVTGVSTTSPALQTDASWTKMFKYSISGAKGQLSSIYVSIKLQFMFQSYPVCLMSKVSGTKVAWCSLRHLGIALLCLCSETVMLPDLCPGCLRYMLNNEKRKNSNILKIDERCAVFRRVIMISGVPGLGELLRGRGGGLPALPCLRPGLWLWGKLPARPSSAENVLSP